ncbi:MAG: HNH endonuclease [Akkermansiaceae bacterium]
MSIITDRQIYAPSLKKLNDPSEGLFLKVPGCEADMKTQRAIDNLRVVSLCRFYSNTLLWSYYADSYSGVCLALSFAEADAPKRVIYRGLFDSKIVRDRNINGHAYAAAQHVRKKLDYWKHEIEYRVIKTAEPDGGDTYVPCTVEGVLFGKDTPEDVKECIKRAGESAKLNIFTDTVKLHPGFSHPCLGTGLGVRANEANNPAWLNDGAGPLTSRPSEDKCFNCGEDDRGNPSIGYYLEEHLIVTLDDPNYYTENNTILLCPNCHRKVHIDPDLLAVIQKEGRV